MTLTGYYFTATGLSEHAFYDDNHCLCRIVNTYFPGSPIRIYHSRQRFAASEQSFPTSEQSFPTSDQPHAVTAQSCAASDQQWGTYRHDGFIRGKHGIVHAEIKVLSARNHFTINVGSEAVTGRVINWHLRKAVVYSGLDGEDIGMVEYKIDRAVRQKAYGELFPQRYVANIKDGVAEDMRIALLSIPFLDIPGIEVG